MLRRKTATCQKLGIATCTFRTFQVMQRREEIESLTVLNAGEEGEGDLQLMKFLYWHPTISEVRAGCRRRYACRKASRGSD